MFGFGFGFWELSALFQEWLAGVRNSKLCKQSIAVGQGWLKEIKRKEEGGEKKRREERKRE